MKLIISILLFPSLIAALLAYGCFAFFRFGINNPLIEMDVSKAHMLKGFLYVAAGSGLSLSIFVFLAGSILTVLSFIFKSWTRAALALGMAASGIYLWMFFLNVPYPL